MTSSDAPKWDVVVIGGGHNGLVAAAMLGKARRKVLLVEAADALGGAARTEEFHPGFRASSVAHLVNRLHPDVVKSLNLAAHGLKFETDEVLPSVALSKDGNPLLFGGAYGETLTGASDAEAAAWKTLRAQLFRYAGILKPFLARRPPDLRGMAFGEKSALGLAALSVRRLGKEDMRDFLRMLLMNVADVLDEHLEDERLRGLLAFDTVLGCHLGPRSPTSLLGLYYRLVGEIDGVAGAQAITKGGMGAVVAALATAAEKVGVTTRKATTVKRILVESGRAVGVELDTGETVHAKTIVSAINPRTTLIDLVGARELDTGIVRKAQHIRMHGDAAKLHLALDGMPAFKGLTADQHRARLVIAPSVDHVEKSFNPSKYGEFSPEPVMEITIPSLVDRYLAPSGAAVLSAVVQFAPYRLKEGWETGKPKLLAAIMATLEDHAPGIGGLVRHAELLTPADIEARYHMPGGHWHHGELQIDQMLVSRPFFGAEGYDTPVEGLFLAGAGSHPGGGISGAPGLNAARRVIEMRG
ncbi:MAG: NAD(P)/FAD-dependent oxidoreductase [Rhizobiaceae bacterium]|nr:NAD(P)/FAD-dependent oxidoreductase [Rhizobiaceae bacterium]